MKLPQNYNMLTSKERKLVREEYVKKQHGLCHYCGSPLDGPAASKVLVKKITKGLFPKGMFKYPVHLHHDHEDGMTIGAVHCYCNAVLWEYEGE
jgi:hypothetical protein